MGLKAKVEKIEDVDAALQPFYVEKDGAFHLQVEGMKTEADVRSLQEALRKERENHKAVKDRLGLLGDRKIEDVLTILDKVPELEAAAAGKLDETKLNEIVETRIKTRLAPVEREKSQIAKRLEELTTLVSTYETRERTRSIQDAVRESIAKQQGFQPSAVEDALLFAERMLEVNEDGKVTTKDNVGVTPGVDAAVWLTEMQAKKSHWWGTTSGGGAAGSSRTAPGTGNPWSKASWNVTEQMRIMKENPTRAEQLKKSAVR